MAFKSVSFLLQNWFLKLEVTIYYGIYWNLIILLSVILDAYALQLKLFVSDVNNF